MHKSHAQGPRILRRLQVQERTGLSRSSIYNYIRQGRFPQPIKLGLRSVGWMEDEINQWLRMQHDITTQASARRLN